MSEEQVRYRTHSRAEYDEEDGSPSIVVGALEATGDIRLLETEAARAVDAPLDPSVAFVVVFQAGPRGVVGVNGCQTQDVLAIALMRLRGFQAGSFPCPENAEAIRHLEKALTALHARTLEAHQS